MATHPTYRPGRVTIDGWLDPGSTQEVITTAMDPVEREIRESSKTAGIDSNDQPKDNPWEFFEALCLYSDEEMSGISVPACSILGSATSETDDLENDIIRVIIEKKKYGLTDQDIYERIGRIIIQACGDTMQRYL